MAYLTATDLQNLFEPQEIIQLSNLHDPSATAINQTRIDAAIQWASGIADSYIAVRYALPLVVVAPVSLVSRIADLVRYQLDHLNPREDVRKRYEDAIKWFELLAKGEVDLGPDVAGKTPVEDNPLIGGPTSYTLGTSYYGGGALSGF